MKTMTESLGAMQIFCDKFGADNFYTINFNKGSVTAQGHFNSSIVAQLHMEGFEMSVDKYGYLTFTAMQDGYLINVVFTS
mgnify:CR=1 FL=1